MLCTALLLLLLAAPAHATLSVVPSSNIPANNRLRLSWPSSDAACLSKGRPDRDTGTVYYPSIVVHVSKRLASGRYAVVDHSFQILPCNTAPQTLSLPNPLPTAWVKQGGAANENGRTFRIDAFYLTPSVDSFEGVDVELSANYPFEAMGTEPKGICAEGCNGPTAQCTSTGCKCFGDYTLSDTNTCVNETPVATPAAVEDVDCQLQAQPIVLEKCSSVCGSGKMKVYTPVAVPKKGKGADCACTDSDPKICIIEEVDCNGALENPDVDCEKLMQVGKLLGACRETEPMCDDDMVCETQPPPAATKVCNVPRGAQDQPCQLTGAPCDTGLLCDAATNKCRQPPVGCLNCACAAGNTCENNYSCQNDRCILPPQPACTAGAENCPCQANNQCLTSSLECVQGVCRVPGIVGSKRCTGGECEAVCTAHANCFQCTESVLFQGVRCNYCKDANKPDTALCTHFIERCAPDTKRQCTPADSAFAVTTTQPGTTPMLEFGSAAATPLLATATAIVASALLVY